MNELIMYSKEFNETYIQRGESLFQKAGGKEEEVTLAVVIICCNEEDVILPCLNSLHTEYLDEIIIVDTGSTDRTREILQEFASNEPAANIYYFAWCDDFAAARNFGMEQAKSDWIFFLDADESMILHNRKPVKDYIRKYAGLYGTDIGIAPVIYNEKNHILYNNPRIFCKKSGYRYFGNVHETLRKEKDVYRFIPFLCLDIRVGHTGYGKKKIKNKLIRNMKYLNYNIKREPDNPLWYCYKLLDGRDFLTHEEKMDLFQKMEEIPESSMDKEYYLFCYNWASILIVKSLLDVREVDAAKEQLRVLEERGSCSEHDLFYLSCMLKVAEMEQNLKSLEELCKKRKESGDFKNSFLNSKGYHIDEVIMQLLEKQHKMGEYYKYKDFLVSQGYLYEIPES